jgi:dCTP deaminase
MEFPWLRWVPGVLNAQQIGALVTSTHLAANPEHAGASALDLPLGDEVWTLREGAVKPGGPEYLSDLRRQHLVIECRPDADGAFRLEQRTTYLVRLQPTLLHREELARAQFYGQATAKSTIGRLDVLVRFILDGMTGYESFGPDELRQSDGSMFVEVTPLSFNVRVRPGQKLSQLRLFYGRPEDVEIRGDLLWRTVVRGRAGAAEDRMLSVSLEPDRIGGLDAVAFSARDGVDNAPLDTWLPSHYEAWRYWRVIGPHDSRRHRVQLEPGRFYILRSKERLWLPEDVAAYCRATDETIGEMRIHYAGFVHPGFGKGRDDADGTPLIFEVRGHDFASNLRDGEKMARLHFYRMSQQAGPDDPTYQKQELKLSALFADWPSRLRPVDDSGIVEPDPTGESS